MTEQADHWNAKQYTQKAGFVSELGQSLLAWLNPQPNERILDVGCGEGALTEKIAEVGSTVVGIDASPAMIAAAKERGLDARVVRSEEMDFNEEFDAVFSNAALHWMKPPKVVVAKIVQALKPEGRFVAELGGAGNVAQITTAIREEMADQGIDADWHHPWYFPTPAEYQQILESQGFSVEQIELFERPTPLPGDILDWLTTFGESFLVKLPMTQRQALLEAVRERLRPLLCDAEGHWTADYVRLRLKAKKTKTKTTF
ncbi:Demethylrebeccamycin-D-glucose O-methyltransferase [Planctomycetales bacterium 10988]|nr:Demethylrebeccamycin-D-glucose O-methyltransferase [Planctomycetales bacterium 10988]